MKYKFSDQVVDFSIPSQYKKVAVNLSGGVESSLLLYMTVKYLQDNDISDTNVVVLTGLDPKIRPEAIVSADIIHFVKEHLGASFLQRHYIHFSYHGDRTEGIHEIERRLYKDGKIDIVLNGTTRDNYEAILENDEGVKKTFGEWVQLNPGRGDRNKLQDELLYSPTPRYPATYTPFRNSDKRMIAYIYSQLGIRDSLFPITRSCMAFVSDGIENYNEICKRCIPCMERKWGFGEW